MRPIAARSTLMMSYDFSTEPWFLIAACTSGSARISSSSLGPSSCTGDAMRADDLPVAPAYVVRNERSRPAVLARRKSRWRSRSARPMSSSSDLKPRSASPARTSSATWWKKLTRSPGVPGKRARSSSRCDATPTGQLLVWHTRAMMQPVAIIAAVPKPYSSAPNAADMRMSRPLRTPPSTRSTTRSRSSLAVSTWCASAKPISMGPPACLIDEMGDAPVPPSWPETWITSAFALATPDAMTPMPASATSLTETLAAWFTWCRS
mmetsp:Transcript_5873/g.18000  ORF Transcript_5873/g.18000 Transcript_5873/m.18000 type:complete len:264 (-) Transcript_5873:3664-4455(-)